VTALDNLPYNDLKRIAQERGMEKIPRSKDALIVALSEPVPESGRPQLPNEVRVVGDTAVDAPPIVDLRSVQAVEDVPVLHMEEENFDGVVGLTEEEQEFVEKYGNPNLKIRDRRPGQHHNPIQYMLTPQNLPAMFTYAWANYILNDGSQLGEYLSLGWKRVAIEDVTTDPDSRSKVYLPRFREHLGYVAVEDCLLVVAERRIIDQRKAASLDRWRDKVQRNHGGRNGDTVQDKVQTTGADGRSQTFMRTSEMRSEDLFGGGE
jgi:hypothetical protein